MIEAKASISTCACFSHIGSKIPTWRRLQAYWPCLPIFVISISSLKRRRCHKTKPMNMIYSKHVSKLRPGYRFREIIVPKCTRTTKLKLNIRSQAIHDWIEPIITSVLINQFAEHVGAGAAINGSPLRFFKRLNSVRVVTIHEHNVDDVTILFLQVRAWYPTESAILTRKPMICWLYQRHI